MKNFAMKKDSEVQSTDLSNVKHTKVKEET
jgi:hypothetical protein